MSVALKPLRYNEHGDPTMTIVVVGHHDVYRLADHMTRGQCEFADIGFRVMRRLRRRNPAGFAWLRRYMHGDGGFR